MTAPLCDVITVRRTLIHSVIKRRHAVIKYDFRAVAIDRHNDGAVIRKQTVINETGVVNTQRLKLAIRFDGLVNPIAVIGRIILVFPFPRARRLDS